MKITFFGTSHGYPEVHRFCSCEMISVGGKNYFIDAGLPLMAVMLNYGATWDKIGGVFITHNHSDHTLGLIEMMERSTWRRCKNKYDWNVYFPIEKPLAQYINDDFRAQVEAAGCVHFHHYTDGVIFEDENIKITAYSTQHCAFAHCFMVEAEGKRVLFSGDLSVGMKEDYPQVLFEKDFDLMVLEGAHTLLKSDEIVDKVKHSRVKKLLINHVQPELNGPEEMKEFFAQVPELSPEMPNDGSVYEL